MANQISLPALREKDCVSLMVKHLATRPTASKTRVGSVCFESLSRGDHCAESSTMPLSRRIAEALADPLAVGRRFAGSMRLARLA
jgi:hypothetical protein